MRLINLGSGSHGNSTYIEGDNTRLLVDAGFTSKELEKRLRQANVEPSSIDAILITHEHSDHVKGVKAFVKKFGTKVFCHKSLRPVFDRILFGLDTYKIVEFDDYDFFISEFTISPIDVPHDAVHTNGFSIFCNGRKISIITDIGHINQKTLFALENSDLVLLESNHDVNMLLTGPYTDSLKKRVVSNHGHLSNVDCAETIVYLAEKGTKNFILAHISEKNNTEEIAKLTCFNALEEHGLSLQVHISIAHQDCIGTNYIIKNKD